MAQGKKTGGRKAGVPNRRTADFAALAGRLKITPQELLGQMIEGSYGPHAILRATMDGNLPCGTCHGLGKTKYQPARGQEKLAERDCESCYGSGKERVTTDQRNRAAAELGKQQGDAAKEAMQYLLPKRKAIEHTGEGGGPLQHAHTIKFID